MPKHPSPPSASHGLNQSQALQRAALALQMGRFGEAEQLAAGVLKASRTDVGAAVMLARALIGQNRGEEAIAPLERVARRVEDPGPPRAVRRSCRHFRNWRGSCRRPDASTRR
jgi:thioredoxin-like negative regulator of GroEL